MSAAVNKHHTDTAQSVAPSIFLTEIEIQRFWAKVQKGEGCWEWQGRKKGAYGSYRVRRGGKWVSIPTHRISFWLHTGTQSDVCVCHSCDNPPCVNPDHLWRGTHSQNAQDRENKGRRRRLYGEHNPMSKLTWEKVFSIRKEYGPKTSYHKLAKKYGVASMVIWDVVNFRTWKVFN